MRHIELFGPPGVGKSTIFANLIKYDQFHGSITRTSLNRLYHKKATRLESILYKMTPSMVKNKFMDEFIQYRFRNYALIENINNNSEILGLLLEGYKLNSEELGKVFSLLKTTVEEYHIGKTTLKKDETLCLDGGFFQLLLAIQWRTQRDIITSTDFTSHIPAPKVLIYVNAPPDVCLGRQKERGRVVVSNSWETGSPLKIQTKLQEMCEDIIKSTPGSTKVITINNVGSPRETTERIRKRILKHQND